MKEADPLSPYSTAVRNALATSDRARTFLVVFLSMIMWVGLGYALTAQVFSWPHGYVGLGSDGGRHAPSPDFFLPVRLSCLALLVASLLYVVFVCAQVWQLWHKRLSNLAYFRRIGGSTVLIWAVGIAVSLLYFHYLSDSLKPYNLFTIGP